MNRTSKIFIAILIFVLLFTSNSFSISFGGRTCSSCSSAEKEEDGVLKEVQDDLNRDATQGKEAGEQTLEEPFINDNSGGMGQQIDDILESNTEITQK